jgi:DNA-binding GntR family transcriptional regulator
MTLQNLLKAVKDGEGNADLANVDDVTGHNTSRLPLANQVAITIRDMIIQDTIKPGERIRERQLSEELNVSRTPLREALKILEGEKLVALLPNRGAVVADPAPDEVRELLQVLGALEALGGRLATENARDAEIAEIKALHYEMLAAYSRGDRLAYFKLNQQIHSSIMNASRNSSLIDTHSHFNARLYRVRYRSNQQNARWHEAIDEHEGLIRALEARDGELLAARLSSHLGATWVKVSKEDYSKDSDA